MPMMKLSCPHCGFSGKANAKLAGTTVACRTCGKEFVAGGGGVASKRERPKGGLTESVVDLATLEGLDRGEAQLVQLEQQPERNPRSGAMPAEAARAPAVSAATQAEDQGAKAKKPPSLIMKVGMVLSVSFLLLKCVLMDFRGVMDGPVSDVAAISGTDAVAAWHGDDLSSLGPPTRMTVAQLEEYGPPANNFVELTGYVTFEAGSMTELAGREGDPTSVIPLRGFIGLCKVDRHGIAPRSFDRGRTPAVVVVPQDKLWEIGRLVDSGTVTGVIGPVPPIKTGAVNSSETLKQIQGAFEADAYYVHLVDGAPSAVAFSPPAVAR